MSAPKKCPHCGERYADFKTGLTFADVKSEMWVGSEDPAVWRSKTRKTVLGYWHERKRALWNEKHGHCEAHAQDEREEKERATWEIRGLEWQLIGVPF